MARPLLYPLVSLAGRLKEQMSRPRDIVLVALALVTTALFDFLLSVATAHWDIPWWAVGVIAVAAILVIALFVFIMMVLYKSLGAMDAEDKAARIRDNDARDRKLAEAINEAAETRDRRIIDILDGMNRALQALQEQDSQQREEVMAALKQNSDTIIKAMREPLDGHE